MGRALAAGLLLVTAGYSGRGTSEPRRLILEHVTVISPGAAKQPGASVAIVGDRIVAVGANIEPRSADTVIDGRGRFLVPGLIDGHVHLALPAGLPFPPPANLRVAGAPDRAGGAGPGAALGNRPVCPTEPPDRDSDSFDT